MVDIRITLRVIISSKMKSCFCHKESIICVSNDTLIVLALAFNKNKLKNKRRIKY